MQHQDLRAEVERLTDDLATMEAGTRVWFEERAKLRAEIERLKALVGTT